MKKGRRTFLTRAYPESIEFIESIALPNETSADVIQRLIHAYQENGLQTELAEKFSDLEIFSAYFIDRNFEFFLENVKALLLKALRMPQEKRGQVAEEASSKLQEAFKKDYTVNSSVNSKKLNQSSEEVLT